MQGKAFLRRRIQEFAKWRYDLRLEKRVLHPNLLRISDVKLKINSRTTPVFSQQVGKKVNSDGGACTDN